CGSKASQIAGAPPHVAIRPRNPKVTTQAMAAPQRQRWVEAATRCPGDCNEARHWQVFLLLRGQIHAVMVVPSRRSAAVQSSFTDAEGAAAGCRSAAVV